MPAVDKSFVALCCVTLVLTVSLALGSGNNEDDSYQHEYSTTLVSYYLTLGADTAALYVPKGNLHYYGGFFEILTGFTNHALGYTPANRRYQDVRHVFNAILGFAAMLFAALFAGEIAGRRAAMLTLAFLALSPGFLGHSLMNPKDIPFAAGYVCALYYTQRFVSEMTSEAPPRTVEHVRLRLRLARAVLALRRLRRRESLERPGEELDSFARILAVQDSGPRFRTSAGLVLGIAVALGTRVVGVILPAYLVLFVAVDLAVKRRGPGPHRLPLRYLLHVAGIIVAGYLAALIFWPFALQSPLRHTLEALNGLTNLQVSIRALFNGANVPSDQVSWDYLPQWIGRTTPLFALVGFGGFFLLGKRLTRYPWLPIFIAVVSTLVPVLYAMARGTAGYDGWRHLLFVYPTMAALAAIFWVTVADWAGSTRGRVAVYAVLGCLVIEPAWFIASNSRFPYVYFNPAAGGTRGAFGNFETDYWGLSVRPALEWMEEQRLIGPDMREPVTIATTFSYAVRSQVEARYRDRVRVIYVRYYERYDQSWDYGIFPSRFIQGAHLRNGTWPNSRSVHTVRAAGAPLLSIEKGGGPVFAGKQALVNGDAPAAIAAFRAETVAHPDDELGWLELSATLANGGRYDEALAAADQMLAVAPDHPAGLLQKGRLALIAGDHEHAEEYLKRSILVQENASAHYDFALNQLRRGDPAGALPHLQRAIELAPAFTDAYELAARICERSGDAAQAARLRAAAARVAAARENTGRP